MLIVSHRGNINGPNLVLENHPDQIDKAIDLGFPTEIDIRLDHNKLYLGHDHCSYEIDEQWLLNRGDNLFIHCKNLQAVEHLYYLNILEYNLNFFYHTGEQVVFTSLNTLWCYPGTYSKYGITVEVGKPAQLKRSKYKEIIGICTDYPIEWKEFI